MSSSLKLANNAVGRLSAGITASATTIVLTTEDGTKFPALAAGEWFPATIVKATGEFEIVKVTARAGNVLTAVRAQEGTTAIAFSAGDRVELRLTAGAFTDEIARVESAASAAQTTANSANTAAGAAQSVANSAQAAADNAQTTADNAQTTANSAIVAASAALQPSSIGVSVQAYDANLTPNSNLGLFKKSNPTVVAWTKTGAGTATTSSTLYIEVNGSIKTIASGTSITMPTLSAGTDYAIWAKTDGTLEATSNHTSPPAANARKVGGFHYAPGGHSGSPGGGNTTPGIWAGSFWDLKFRPVCPDPRGMEYKFGSWMDMYLTNTDAITLGSSRYNVTIADGSSPPKVPTVFGGNGSTTYGSYTWFEAAELASFFEKRLPTQREFMAHAYGTTEASSIGTDQGSTIHNAANAAYMSAAGLFQATGVMWIWADDRGGAYNTGGWNANTEGRGSEYNAPNAALVGGDWGNGAASGSRSSNWVNAASGSSDFVGSRFCCDHLQLD